MAVYPGQIIEILQTDSMISTQNPPCEGIEFSTSSNWKHEASRSVHIELLRQTIIVLGAVCSVPYIEKAAGSFIDQYPNQVMTAAFFGLYPFFLGIISEHYKSLKETGRAPSNVLVTAVYKGLNHFKTIPDKARLVTAATIGTIACPFGIDVLTTIGSWATAQLAYLTLSNVPENLMVKLFVGATVSAILATEVQHVALHAERNIEENMELIHHHS